MLHEVIVPKTGIYMDDVLLLEWVAAEGARVEAGQVLFRMETNKVEMDIESEASGHLHCTGIPGDEYPIGTQIGTIAETEAEYRALVAAGSGSG